MSGYQTGWYDGMFSQGIATAGAEWRTNQALAEADDAWAQVRQLKAIVAARDERIVCLENLVRAQENQIAALKESLATKENMRETAEKGFAAERAELQERLLNQAVEVRVAAKVNATLLGEMSSLREANENLLDTGLTDFFKARQLDRAVDQLLDRFQLTNPALLKQMLLEPGLSSEGMDARIDFCLDLECRRAASAAEAEAENELHRVEG